VTFSVDHISEPLSRIWSSSTTHLGIDILFLASYSELQNALHHRISSEES